MEKTLKTNAVNAISETTIAQMNELLGGSKGHAVNHISYIRNTINKQNVANRYCHNVMWGRVRIKILFAVEILRLGVSHFDPSLR